MYTWATTPRMEIMMSRLVEFTEAGDVESSAIDYYWYDAGNKEFYVRFTGGAQRVAGYKDVPEATVDSFVNAHSHGSYYSRYIKGRYTGLNSDVVFQKKPVRLAVYSNGDIGITGNITASAIAASPMVEAKTESRQYKVYAMVEIKDVYNTTSIEDAVAAFLDDYDSESQPVKVTKVEVLFD